MKPYQEVFDPRDLDFSKCEELAAYVVEPLVAALRADGIEPLIGADLERIAAIHEMSRTSDRRMTRLSPSNDPGFHPEAGPDDTVVMVLEQGGHDIGCIASRIINCEGTLGDAMVDGRFWYGSSPVPPEHDCRVTAERAWDIEDRPVLYTASIYLDLSITHTAALSAMVRLHHVWVTTHRFWSDGIGLAEPAIARRHATDIYGISDLGHWVWRAAPGEQDMAQFALLWSSRKRARALLTSDLGDLHRPIGVPDHLVRRA